MSAGHHIPGGLCMYVMCHRWHQPVGHDDSVSSSGFRILKPYLPEKVARVIRRHGSREMASLLELDFGGGRLVGNACGRNVSIVETHQIVPAAFEGVEDGTDMPEIKGVEDMFNRIGSSAVLV